MADTVMLAMLLLLLAVVVSALLRRFPLPDSVALVLAGVALAELSRRWAPAAQLSELRLSPDLVFFVLLPVLVFESGLNLDTRRLLRNLAPVVTLAVPALIASTAVVGIGLWLATGMQLLVALLFGALISATDPVAVMALFREVGAPPRLGVLVEGESLFNDATAIVVFGLLLGLLVSGDALDLASLGGAVLRFVVVFLGGALCGVAGGAVASELSHRLALPTPAVLAVSVAIAYLSFIIAEHGLHVSGVMASVGASITFGALGVTRFTRDTRQVLSETWGLLAFVCNALLFLLVGLAVDLLSVCRQWPLLLAAVALVYGARAAAVYGLIPLTTRTFGLPTVTPAERHIIWWGGLKGGLAVAIALSIPDSLPERQLVLDVTAGVVLFTLLINATSLRALMHRLGLDRLSGEERAELDDAVADARARVEASLDEFRRDGLMSSSVHHRLVRDLLRDLAPAPASGALQAAHLAALRAESIALDALYESRAIDQYAFVALREVLLEAREGGGDARPASLSGDLFKRVEAAALRWLRERDWAAAVLARYQEARLTGHLQHDLAGVVMAGAALDVLERREDRDQPGVQALVRQYRQRAARRRARLASMHDEFPELLERFEERSFRRAALVGALQASQRAAQHGQLGTRAAVAVSRRLDEALRKGSKAKVDGGGLRPRELMQRAPVFRGLSRQSLDALAAEARPVTFLPGDVIIGEGEHGDALYVISRGRVAVSRAGADGQPERLAERADGDIFGEAALLGESVRNATVTALSACTLLRITRAQALSVAATWPEVSQRLEHVDRGRH